MNNNASTLFQLAFDNKQKLDRLYGSGKYRLVAEAFADYDQRAPEELPPVLVAIGEAGQPADLYGYVELDREVPKRGKIDLHQTSEAMLLRIVIDRLISAKADEGLIKSLRERVPEVVAASKRAIRQPDPVPKPKAEKPPETTPDPVTK